MFQHLLHFHISTMLFPIRDKGVTFQHEDKQRHIWETQTSRSNWNPRLLPSEYFVSYSQNLLALILWQLNLDYRCMTWNWLDVWEKLQARLRLEQEKAGTEKAVFRQGCQVEQMEYFQDNAPTNRCNQCFGWPVDSSCRIAKILEDFFFFTVKK